MDTALYLRTLQELLKIDSVSGQYNEIQKHIVSILHEQNVPYTELRKGGVIADLGGASQPLMLIVHCDTIGLMVRGINPNGTLTAHPVGGISPYSIENESVRIYTRGGDIFQGSVHKRESCIHVNSHEYNLASSGFDTNLAVYLMADTSSKEQTEKLGIQVGDYIAFEPKYTFHNGYINSRFLDDKAAVALILQLMISNSGQSPKRNVRVFFSMYEEIGIGCNFAPDGVEDVISIDIACVGTNQNSNEHKMSIFAFDSKNMFNYNLINELIATANKAKADYVLDAFTPSYGTDGDSLLIAGYDIRNAAVGFGVLASHGYERTHLDSLKQLELFLRELLFA